MTRAWPRIAALGDAAVLVETGLVVGTEESRRVRAVTARLATATADRAGWGAPVPAACSVLVPVDPIEPGVEAAIAIIEAALRSFDPGTASDPTTSPAGRLIEIPTRYGGPDGPDLEVVAEMTGLSAAAVIDAHAAGTYEALFLGFMPGFAYLGPLPAPLVLPRRGTPRTAVPAGSVAIGGAQTAVYPMASPGGWWLLGRTDATLWDPQREEPASILPGDRVRFVPVSDPPHAEAGRPATAVTTARPPVDAATFEVVEGGLQTTIQDGGRPGLGAFGVPRSGAADRTSLAIANTLAGNQPAAAALEATLVGPELLVRRDVVIGLAGADLGAVTGAGRRLQPGAAHRLRAGERLRLPGPAEGGARAYLAVAGGFEVPLVLGAAATSLVGGFGGHEGRALWAGDMLHVLPIDAGTASGQAAAARRWPADSVAAADDAFAILPGPAASGPGDVALQTLLAEPWHVAGASDRRGLRLDGPALDVSGAADAPSHGVPTGTIQLTPSGQPLVLLVDAGPTGGYPVLAVVASADLDRLGQLRPGDELRFRAVDAAVARAAELERRERFATLVARATTLDPWDDLADHAGA